MPGRDAAARQLLDLYRSDIRAFLAEHEAPNLDSLDQSAELLDRSLSSAGDLKVGFVGEAQVGKSTLINALLDRHALPSGGIGPLTAQTTRVTYADEHSLAVTYHGRQQLNRLAFGIARYLELRGELQQGSLAAAGEPDSDTEVPDDGSPSAALADADSAESGDERQKRDVGRYMLDQARRILHFANSDWPGESPPDVVLLDGVRAILGQKPFGDAEPLRRFSKRITDVQNILGQSQELSESSEGGTAAFNKALRQRAAGWLSPLVAELHLRLRAETLRGLTLVDLPGIGVVGDPAGRQAEQFVRTEGDALIVVFRNSGVTETVAGLLERTGVITKLLFGGRDNIAPIQVVLAVTHLDDVAKDRYRQLSDEARDNGEPIPDRHDIYRLAAREMEEKLRDMIGAALRASRAFDDLPEDQRKTRETVVERLCQSMQIYCVSSPDYLSAMTSTDDGMAFLRDLESTSVPDLRRNLLSLARQADTRRSQTVSQYHTALRTAISDHLRAIAQMYEEGRGVAIRDFERFRDAIVTAAAPLREEMRAYHGEAVGVLRKAMQSELRMLCNNAEMAGLKKLRRVSKDAREKHFMSLRAAFNRNGVWDSRDINYPIAITSAMVDSIASEWEGKIVEKVRDEVRALADRDLKLVERLCETARETNERILADTPIDAQKGILKANSRTAVAWTKDQLEDLRQNVSSGLRVAVEKPIEWVCSRARRQLVHEGRGAKNRIIDTFEVAGEEAIKQASEQAEQLLKDHYARLLRRLNEGFLKENHDPVQAAVDTLTGEQIAKARRADAQRKRNVTAHVSEFTATIASFESDVPSLPEAAKWHSATVSV